jgi:DNA end-binding protein Ku
VKPNQDLLVLELMHFPADLANPQEELKLPPPVKVAPRELQMAEQLIGQMSSKWDPARYTDDYKSALLQMIEQKVKSGGRELPTTGGKRRQPSNVIDLMAALKQSLNQASGRKGATRKAPKEPAAKGRRGRRAA